MKQHINSFVVVCVGGLLAGCGMGPLNVLGVGKNGQFQRAGVSEYQYRKVLTRTLNAVDATVLPVLREKQGNHSELVLRTVVVGVALKVEGGIGPLKASIKPGIFASFSNGQKPPIP